MQYRSTAGGTSTSVAQVAGVAPLWLRLRRSTNTFTGEWSTDNTTWRTLGSITVTMGTDVHAGLALTSHKHRGDRLRDLLSSGRALTERPQTLRATPQLRRFVPLFHEQVDLLKVLTVRWPVDGHAY